MRRSAPLDFMLQLRAINCPTTNKFFIDIALYWSAGTETLFAIDMLLLWDNEMERNLILKTKYP